MNFRKTCPAVTFLASLFFVPIIDGRLSPGNELITDRVTLSANQLVSTEGELFDLAKSVAERQLTVICFLGTECPMVKLYSGRLGEIDAHYGDAVQVLGIDSNRQDSTDDIREFCSGQQIRFPVLCDQDNRVADDFGATRTPEVFLVDDKLNVLYRGAIDDQFSPGVSRARATQNYLIDAIEEAIQGKTVSVPVVEATGCLIGRMVKSKTDSPITFSRQVSRILQNHCIECHRTGEIGPFPLTDYEEVSGWGDTIVEVIDNNRMPPWHAKDGLAPLENARFMPTEEKQIIRDWVLAGMPEGDPAESPPQLDFPAGWRLPRKPDAVFEMAKTPFEVPAEGVVDYQYFVVDPGFRHDVWIAAAEIVPGNRRVVHHSIVFIRPPEDRRTFGFGWLGAYVPGQSAPEIIPGHATFVPAGSKLVFQQHYTPSGRIETDSTRVGLVFAKAEDVTHLVYTLASMDQEFEIDPGEPARAVQSQLRNLSPNASLLAVSPHMHFRGKSYRLSWGGANGVIEPLVEVPAYDFNWQHSYRFANPYPLRDVEFLQSDFVFDNSRENAFNPDPGEYVTWGDQTWEEMAVSFLTVAEPLDAVHKENSRLEMERRQSVKGNQDQAIRHAESKGDQIMEILDKNDNGRISRAEAPRSFRHFAFDDYDSDKDGSITRDECVSFLLGKWHEQRNR